MKTRWFGGVFTAVFPFIILFATCGLKQVEEQDKAPGLIRVERHYYTAPPMPDTVSFMGHPVPLDRFDVRESLERELIVNSYFHSQTLRLIKLAPRFFSILDPVLADSGIPSDFRYLAVAESGLNPKALSPAGAAGIWQFMRPAATDY